MNRLLFALTAFCVFLTTTNANANPYGVMGHKAIYNVNLSSHKMGASIIGLNGQITYILKRTCGGFITNQQLKLNYQYSNDSSSSTQSKFTNFESGNGKELQFSSIQRNDGEIESEFRGFAQIGDKSFAKYTIPDDLSHNLHNDTLFPIAHTMQLLNVATAGGKVLNAHVFDGSDDSGAVEINAIIGAPLINDWVAPKDVNTSLISKQNVYPIRMAVFDENTEPEYEMSILLLSNGIIRDMIVDYSDFSIHQKLISLEQVKDTECGEINNGVK